MTLLSDLANVSDAASLDPRGILLSTFPCGGEGENCASDVDAETTDGSSVSPASE
jgi:hypothetical protein